MMEFVSTSQLWPIFAAEISLFTTQPHQTPQYMERSSFAGPSQISFVPDYQTVRMHEDFANTGARVSWETILIILKPTTEGDRPDFIADAVYNVVQRVWFRRRGKLEQDRRSPTTERLLYEERQHMSLICHSYVTNDFHIYCFLSKHYLYLSLLSMGGTARGAW